MAKSKGNKSVLGYVFAALILVGLILVIVGMFVGQVTMKAESSLAGASESTTFKLFDSDAWGVTEIAGKKVGVSNTFAIIAFIVTLVGALVLCINALLKILGKDVKFLGFIGAALTLVGAILVLVAGLIMASQCTDQAGADLGSIAKVSYSAGAGVWLGFVGGLIAAVAGGLSSLKQFN